MEVIRDVMHAVAVHSMTHQATEETRAIRILDAIALHKSNEGETESDTLDLLETEGETLFAEMELSDGLGSAFAAIMKRKGQLAHSVMQDLA